jgi:hypothetical protein
MDHGNAGTGAGFGTRGGEGPGFTMMKSGSPAYLQLNAADISLVAHTLKIRQRGGHGRRKIEFVRGPRARETSSAREVASPGTRSIILGYEGLTVPPALGG